MFSQPHSSKDLRQQTSALHSDLVRRIAARTPQEGENLTAIPGLALYRRSMPSACTTAAYKPGLVLFVQGKKRVNIGKTSYLCDGSSFLLTSVDLPVVSQVLEATPQKPLLSLLWKLDLPEVRRVLHEAELPAPSSPSEAVGMAIGVASPALLDACCRLVGLLDTPEDVPFLSHLLQREIIYHLLRSPQGKHLRAIATLGEQSNRAARAIAWLLENYARPLRVEELAALAQMGVSTFHHHFRSLTGMSPLQYQKQLRLHMARERMLHDGLDATRAAFEVGYESPSQFSREYCRFFGQPPMRDVKSRRQEILLASD